MPEEKAPNPDSQNLTYTNWTWPDSVHIIVDEHGIKICKGDVIFLEMGYEEIAEIVDRIESMEQEIGNLWDAINGMKEASEE